MLVIVHLFWQGYAPVKARARDGQIFQPSVDEIFKLGGFVFRQNRLTLIIPAQNLLFITA